MLFKSELHVLVHLGACTTNLKTKNLSWDCSAPDDVDNNFLRSNNHPNLEHLLFSSGHLQPSLTSFGLPHKPERHENKSK